MQEGQKVRYGKRVCQGIFSESRKVEVTVTSAYERDVFEYQSLLSYCQYKRCFVVPVVRKILSI